MKKSALITLGVAVVAVALFLQKGELSLAPRSQADEISRTKGARVVEASPTLEDETHGGPRTMAKPTQVNDDVAARLQFLIEDLRVRESESTRKGAHGAAALVSRQIRRLEARAR